MTQCTKGSAGRAIPTLAQLPLSRPTTTRWRPWFALVLLAALARSPAVAAPSFQPDEPIASIQVKVHTADVSEAGTDDDVYVELFPWPAGVPNPTGLRWTTEIDTDWHDDFERNSTRTYALPTWYFKGRIVNDIDRVCIRKTSDGLWGGWALGYVTVTVNGKELYTSLNVNNPSAYRWLEDDHRSWCADNFQRVEFQDPVIETLGLPDASSNQDYKVPLTTVGGRKPLTWTLTASSGTAFTAKPQLIQPSGTTDGTKMVFTARTTNTSTTASWTGTIKVTDADGRFSLRNLSMKVIFALPPPTISSFTPTFGWPAVNPVESPAVKVTISGANFDSRKAGATSVSFAGPGGTRIQAKVLQVTGSQVQVTVPKGAVPGKVGVSTAFGQAQSPLVFTAHPNGYRFISGFPFVNDPSDFADSFAWERYEQAFGVCEMWICVAGYTTVPNPVAGLFYLATKGIIDNGVCHGMSLTSLQMKKGILTTSGFAKQNLPYPLDDALWDMSGPTAPSSALSKWVQSRQLVTLSDEALSYYLHKLDVVPNVLGQLCQMDARYALNDMNAALSTGLADPRMLAFAKNCSPFAGHVVVPYATETDGANRNIRVWDPNRPGITDDPDDRDSYFWVKPGSGQWGYKWSEGEIWDGLYMFTIPLSAYGHQEDWSLPGFGATISALGILLGFAAIGGDGEIAQVTDASGKELFLGDGSVKTNRGDWPEGVRPAPLFDPGGSKPKLVVLTGDNPVTFTVRPRTGRADANPETPFLTIQRGSDLALSVEEVSAPMSVGFDPKTDSLRVAPVSGKGSAILRVARRFEDTAESLSYAVRVHDIAAGRPVTATKALDGRGLTVRAGDAPVTMDLEVTHVNRIGEQRLMESDGIGAPARSVASFQVSRVEDLDAPGKTPVTLDLDVDGTGKQVKRSLLGQKVSGLMVPSLPRMVSTTRAAVAALPINLDVSKTYTPTPETPVRFRSLSGPQILSQRGGTLSFRVPQGTHVLRLVAEDDTGRRSFPRTVFLTAPEDNEPIRSSLLFFGEDATLEPGASASVPVGIYLPSLSTNRLTLDLSTRQRLSGTGKTWPLFVGTGFRPSEEMKALGAEVRSEIRTDGLSLHLEISWDPARARDGRIDLGSLTLRLPEGTPLGSTYLLRAQGAATDSRVAGAVVQQPVGGVPIMLRVWGGPEPASASVTGPTEVGEEAQITLQAAAPGLPAGTRNAGWWVEGMGGRATIAADPANPFLATVTGQRAGRVRVHLVVGTQRASATLLVKPTVKPTIQGRGTTFPGPIRFPVPGLNRRVRGDTDGDEKLTITDAISVLRFSVGLVTPTQDEALDADQNGDGSVNVADVVGVLRVAVGLAKPVVIDPFQVLLPDLLPVPDTALPPSRR